METSFQATLSALDKQADRPHRFPNLTRTRRFSVALKHWHGLRICRTERHIRPGRSSILSPLSVPFPDETVEIEGRISDDPLEPGGPRRRSGRFRCPHCAELCAAYWYPIYALVRRLGHAEANALDRTQAYFARLLEKPVLATADQSRGRFRRLPPR